MTEFQEFMLSVCFGGMCGVFIAELGILITSLIGWVRGKIRKRKESKKNKDTSSELK